MYVFFNPKTFPQKSITATSYGREGTFQCHTGCFIDLEPYARHGSLYQYIAQAERQCTQLYQFFIDTLHVSLETRISQDFPRSWDYHGMYFLRMNTRPLLTRLYFNICNSSFGTRSFLFSRCKQAVPVLNYLSVPLYPQQIQYQYQYGICAAYSGQILEY